MELFLWNWERHHSVTAPILIVSRFTIRDTSFHLQNLFLPHFLISFLQESKRNRTVNIVFIIPADINFHFSLDYQLFQLLKEPMSLTLIMIIVTFIFSSFSNVVQIFFQFLIFFSFYPLLFWIHGIQWQISLSLLLLSPCKLGWGKTWLMHIVSMEINTS